MLLVALLSLPFIALLARSRVLRRLALRNPRRRPREAALVVLGALLGTAIITGSFVVGDTLASSIRRSAYTQLGPVDEVVQSDGVGPAAQVAATVERAARKDVDGLLPVVTVDAAVAARGDRRSAEPRAQVLEVDFAAARRFGGDAGATGISGPTPAPGEAVLGRDLAETLGAGPGDVVEVFAYGNRLTLEVRRVLPRLGLAGFHVGIGSESPNVFVAPGTLAGLVARAPAGASPPTSLVLVSNEGGVIDGADATATVTARLEEALAGLPAVVRPVKRDLLRDADEGGREFTELFASIGFFSVLAGVLLLVNIFVMLAEERKTELGMLRAVGLRRAGLVGAFALEGWIYCLASTAAGVVAGLGVGRLIVFVAAGIFAAGRDFSIELRYAATWGSVQNGFVVGFVMSLLTVTLTSLRISRLNVIRAIRDLPDPPASGHRPVVLALSSLLLVAGGALTVLGLQGREPVAALAGPALVALGAVPLLRRFVPRRPLVTTAALAVLAWATFCFDLAHETFRNPEIVVFVVDGVTLVGAAVALVSQNQDVLGRALRRLGGGPGNLSLRLGLAYPLARRFRTGMILTMYSLVVFTLSAITLFSDVFARQVDDFTDEVSGGFDLRVASNPANPVPADAVRALPGVERVATLSAVQAEFRPAGFDGFEAWPLVGYGEDWLAGGPPALEDRPPGYRRDVDAYRAVLREPDLVIVDQFFLQQGGGPPEAIVRIGAALLVRDPRTGASRNLRVAAVSESSFGSSAALVSHETLRLLGGSPPVPNLLWVATSRGTDPAEVAAAVNGRFLEQGADAVSFREEVGEGLDQQRQFFRLMQGYLALGLVVGIAGLGVVMVRAVRERRRQIGVLRALGFPTEAVRRAFVSESAFVALEGILVGVALAVLSTWRLLTSGTFGEGIRFRVAWGELAVLVVATFAASILATIAPAQQASRIRPAVALRISD